MENGTVSAGQRVEQTPDLRLVADPEPVGKIVEKTGGGGCGGGMTPTGSGTVVVQAVLPGQPFDRFRWQKQIRDDPRLSSTDKLLAWALLTWMNADGYCYPSLETLAEAMSCGRSTVAEHIKDGSPLVDLGYLKIGSHVDPTRKKKAGRPVNSYLALMDVSHLEGTPPADLSAPPGRPVGPPDSNKVQPLDYEDPVVGRSNVQQPDENREVEQTTEQAKDQEHSPRDDTQGVIAPEIDPHLEHDLIERLEEIRADFEADDQFVPTILAHFLHGKNGHTEWRGWLTLNTVEDAYHHAWENGDDAPAFFYTVLRDKANGYG